VYRYLPGFDWFFLDAITANNIRFASDEKYVDAYFLFPVSQIFTDPGVQAVAAHQNFFNSPEVLQEPSTRPNLRLIKAELHPDLRNTAEPQTFRFEKNFF